LWWEHTELLPEFVRLMRGQQWDRLILVDNASSHVAHAAYHDAVATIGGNASVLRRAENSVLAGWNEGIAALGTDVVVQMANDVIMADPRWLAWAVDNMRPGILQGPVLCEQPGIPIAYLDGCLTVAWGADWARLGGLDEGYQHPGYWSDVDLAYRASRAGITIRRVRSGIHHLCNISTRGTPDAAAKACWLTNRARLQRLWQDEGEAA
jgi:hypothetical protein